MQAYLSRLLEFQSTRAPSMDPRPCPIETEAEQHRRLMMYCDNLQQARRQVADQRRLGRDGTCEAAQHADAASTRGNDAIRAGRVSDAFKAYSEAIMALAGRESEPVAAWPLLLALSNRSEALQQLGRHEEVLEDVTSAVVLLDRFGSADDGVALYPAEADLERLRETLARREATSGRELAAQQERGECAEAETRRASERRQLRADRRRRACEARAARRAQEQASEMADAVAALHVAANKVAPTDASRPVHAEPLPSARRGASSVHLRTSAATATCCTQAVPLCGAANACGCSSGTQTSTTVRIAPCAAVRSDELQPRPRRNSGSESKFNSHGSYGGLRQAARARSSGCLVPVGRAFLFFSCMLLNSAGFFRIHPSLVFSLVHFSMLTLCY